MSESEKARSLTILYQVPPIKASSFKSAGENEETAKLEELAANASTV